MIRSGRHAILVTTRTAPLVVWVFAGLLPMAVAGWPVPVLAEEPAKQDQEEERKPEEKKEAAKPAPPAASPKPKTGTPPAAPAAPPPTLRFTDDDLDKYRRPAPMEELEEEPDAAPVASAPAKPAAASVQDPKAPRRLLTKPKPRPAPPPPDPLKAFKERDAMEDFRAEQIRTLRDRATQLEGRLTYLKAKQDALVNPGALQVGQTRGQEGAPGEPPPPKANPYRPGDPHTGAGKIAIGGFFPPIPPAQTEDDKQKDKTLKVRDLIADIKKEMETVEADLAQVREDLVAAELRFGSGAAIP